ncbi:BgTH12-05039 [Blumeria graminis f. sp. triticale]|nr:BgTH12-05039 [Blumeria graminis f. sp. triticale]
MKVFSLISFMAISSHLTPGIAAEFSNYLCDHIVINKKDIEYSVDHAFKKRMQANLGKFKPDEKFGTAGYITKY